MSTERKTPQKLNTYATDAETEEKLFELVMRYSKDAGKPISKSAIIRTLIADAVLWEEGNETP